MANAGDLIVWYSVSSVATGSELSQTASTSVSGVSSKQPFMVIGSSLLVFTKSTRMPLFLKNQGNGVFAPFEQVQSLNNVSQPYWTRKCLSNSTAEVFVFSSDSHTGWVTFTASTGIFDWTEPQGMHGRASDGDCADLNGDGGADLVVVGSDTIGSGSAYLSGWGAQQSLQFSLHAQLAVATADIDLDGDLVFCCCFFLHDFLLIVRVLHRSFALSFRLFLSFIFSPFFLSFFFFLPGRISCLSITSKCISMRARQARVARARPMDAQTITSGTVHA